MGKIRLSILIVQKSLPSAIWLLPSKILFLAHLHKYAILYSTSQAQFFVKHCI